MAAGFPHLSSHRIPSKTQRRSCRAQSLFDPQGSTDTYDTCINSGGAISGYYTDINGVYHGFVRASNGDITTIDPQGSTGTFPTYINPGGVVSGYYNDASYHSHGFVYQTNGH